MWSRNWDHLIFPSSKWCRSFRAGGDIWIKLEHFNWMVDVEPLQCGNKHNICWTNSTIYKHYKWSGFGHWGETTATILAITGHYRTPKIAGMCSILCELFLVGTLITMSFSLLVIQNWMWNSSASLELSFNLMGLFFGSWCPMNFHWLLCIQY